MDWSIIGTIASIVGVVGGLISVCFLIFEIRHNAMAIEGATVQSLMGMEFNTFSYLSEHADLYLRGLEDFEGLDQVEAFRFMQAVKLYMSLYYAAFKQHEQQLIDAEVWDAYAASLKDNLKHSGFATCWQKFHTSYPEIFRNLLTTL
jgi:hypothetical protein